MKKCYISNNTNTPTRQPKLTPVINKVFTISKNYKNNAFTLAEVLTTLMVIGVVAVLTVPNLIQNFQEQTMLKQRTVFTKKFEEGLKQMRVADKLNTQYSSTEEFVDEMKRYFKIVQVCNNDNLSNCFTSKFTASTSAKNSDGTEKENTKLFYTSNLSTTKSISEYTPYDTNIIGLKFSDGVNVLITYDPTCIGPEAGNTQGDLTKCFGYIADINTSKAPNTVGKDIISNMLLVPFSFKVSSEGFLTSDTYGFISQADQTPEIISKYNLKSQINDTHFGYTDDYWAGAMRYCQDLEEDGGGWHLPTKEQLTELADAIYANADCSTITTNSTGTQYGGWPDHMTVCDKEITSTTPIRQWMEAQTLKSPNESINIWGNEEKTGQATSLYRRFNPQFSDSYGDYRGYSHYFAICVK